MKIREHTTDAGEMKAFSLGTARGDAFSVACWGVFTAKKAEEWAKPGQEGSGMRREENNERNASRTPGTAGGVVGRAAASQREFPVFESWLTGGFFCVVSMSLCGFPPNTLVSSYSLKACRFGWLESLNCPSVWVWVNGVCVRPAIGWHIQVVFLPHAQCMLGKAPAPPVTLTRNKRVGWWKNLCTPAFCIVN